MMTEQKITSGHEVEDSISFAALPDQIVVIRITGRGSFHNSMELRRLAEALTQHPPDGPGNHPKFIIDLEDCVTMDSTFMGVLASIGLNQLKNVGDKLVVVNVNEQNMRLLKTLGLTQFLHVREMPAHAQVDDADFQCIIREDTSRTDRIIHMIEAHKDLCEADPTNNLRFESVLKYLQDSLEREKK
jgi:anti-sigma B factor antagonist